MSYSTNSTQFGQLAWYYDYGNGTILYFNGSYPMNFVCNATTDADPDIGGPGVLSSFLATAWITLFVALVPAFYQLRDLLNDMKAEFWSSSPTRPSLPAAAHKSMENSPLVKAAYSTLDSLCDIQLFTGIAIATAGLSQLPTISFYHESLAVSYWILTLNSFFAAQLDYVAEDFLHISRGVTMRRVGILISVIFGLVFEVYVSVREPRDWNFLGHGACYLSHDHSTNWIWVAGTTVYAVSLLLLLIPATRWWVSTYYEMLDRGQEKLVKWQKNTFSALRGRHSHRAATISRLDDLYSKALQLLKLALSSVSVIFYWLLVQFISIWSYGRGFGPLMLISYFAFAAWTTFDIVDLKVSNRALIDGDETHWGFG